MSTMHYTLQQVMRMQPALANMIKEIVTDVLTPSSEVIGKEVVYKLVTGNETNETVDFKFIIKNNVLDDLVGKHRLDVRDMEAYRKRPAVTATTHLNGRPFAVTFQQDDLEMSLEDALKQHAIEEVAQQFMEHIAGSMAASWYFHGLHDRIALWNSESNFEAIKDHFNGMIDVMWDDHGYGVDVLVPDPKDIDSGVMKLIKRNVSFNGLPQHPNPTQSEQQICQRYLDLGIISLIAFGLTEKGFSWTLN